MQKEKKQENEHGISSYNKVKTVSLAILSAIILFLINNYLNIKIVYNLQKSFIIILLFCFTGYRWNGGQVNLPKAPHGSSPPSLTLVQGDPVPSSGLGIHQTRISCMDRQGDKRPTHFFNSFLKCATDQTD